MSKTLIKNYQRILIIQWSAMGDCVLASTTFDDIKQYFPDAKIDLNTLPPWDQLFIHDHRFHQLISFKIRKQGFKATKQWLDLLKQENYDLIIDFQNSDRSRLMLSIAKIFKFTKATIIGRSKHWCYDNNIAEQEITNNHVVDRYYAALKSIGIQQLSECPKIIASDEIAQNIQNQKTKITQDGSFAVFVPGCSPQHPQKRWPTQSFIELGQLLFKNNIQHILIIGAQSEADICKEIAQSDSRFINLCSQTSLLEIPEWLKGASLIVGNDTGTSHMAASSNSPLIALFGPTDPVQSQPYGSKVIALQAQNFGNDNKIDQITANDVLTTYQNIFNPSDKTV